MLGLLGGLAVQAGTSFLNNQIAEWHADKAFDRQKELMQMQNKMNRANNVNAPGELVQGMKLAGLNPAMAQSQQAPVANVSQGSAPKGENVEMSPGDILTMAQAENLNADTRKKNAEVQNVQEDTNLKVAQTVYTGATTEEVQEKAQEIRNINDRFAEQNKFLSENGKSVAENWKKSQWYVQGSDATKSLVDKIANGTIPLTIGSLDGLNNLINQSSNMSEKDRSNYYNEVMDVVFKTQFDNDKVLDAMAELPLWQQRKVREEIDHIKAQVVKTLEESKTERHRPALIDAQTALTKEQEKTEPSRRSLMAKQGVEAISQADINVKKLQQLQGEFESFMTRDLGINRQENDVGGYLLTLFEESLGSILALIGGLKAAKFIKGVPKSGGNPVNQEKQNKTFYNGGLSDWTNYKQRGEGIPKGEGYSPTFPFKK